MNKTKETSDPSNNSQSTPESYLHKNLWWAKETIEKYLVTETNPFRKFGIIIIIIAIGAGVLFKFVDVPDTVLFAVYGLIFLVFVVSAILRTIEKER